MPVMLDSLSEKLSGVFQKLGSRGTITEKDLDEAMREVRVALLEADVNFKVVRQFIASVRERALGAEVLKSLSGPQQVIGIVNEELVNILGGSQSTLQLASKPPTASWDASGSIPELRFGDRSSGTACRSRTPRRRSARRATGSLRRR